MVYSNRQPSLQRQDGQSTSWWKLPGNGSDKCDAENPTRFASHRKNAVCVGNGVDESSHESGACSVAHSERSVTQLPCQGTRHCGCPLTHRCPPLSFPSDGTLSSSLRDTAGTPATRFSICTLHSRRTHRGCALDDHQDRHAEVAQRRRVFVCLGARSRTGSSHLVCKPISCSLALLLTHYLFLFPSRQT